MVEKTILPPVEVPITSSYPEAQPLQNKGSLGVSETSWSNDHNVLQEVFNPPLIKKSPFRSIPIYLSKADEKVHNFESNSEPQESPQDIARDSVRYTQEDIRERLGVAPPCEEFGLLEEDVSSDIETDQNKVAPIISLFSTQSSMERNGNTSANVINSSGIHESNDTIDPENSEHVDHNQEYSMLEFSNKRRSYMSERNFPGENLTSQCDGNEGDDENSEKSFMASLWRRHRSDSDSTTFTLPTND